MTTLKDTLTDILKHSNNEFFTNIRIDGTEDGITFVSASDDDKTFIMNATLKNDQIEFDGATAGMGSLAYLRGLMAWDPFHSTDGDLKVAYKDRGDDSQIPDSFLFSNVDSGAAASYRLMHESAMKVPPVYKEGLSEWDIEIVPTREKINELSQLATLLIDVEKHFIVKVEDGDLTILIGEEGSASHKASLLFATGIEGTYSSIMKWGIPQTLNLLKLIGAGGDSKLKINKKGVLCVTIDSGLADYNFYVVADTK